VLRPFGATNSREDLDWPLLAFWVAYLGVYVVCLIEGIGHL
jgi:hypothetical protein